MYYLIFNYINCLKVKAIRLLVLVLKCNFQFKWVLLMRPVKPFSTSTIGSLITGTSLYSPYTAENESD